MVSEIRYAAHPGDVKNYTTDQLRANYLIDSVMKPGEISCVYSMHDRMITLGIVPVDAPITLPSFEEYTKSEYFLERRELGIFNVGGAGSVIVDGVKYDLQKKECLYIGKGSKDVVFASESANEAAEFFVNSCPAHKEYPTTKAAQSDANEVNLGVQENSNERTIYQFIHEDGIQSCQLVMGFTTMKPGSIWNTFPPHTHNRRMEVYFYFDVPENQVVIHFMGDPEETRHLVMHNKQAVISPEWSIHSGAGTSAYSFVWGMAGENKAFTDMDAVDINALR
ncbi:5-dehydro-4-deoxy-D-glucuronate isomerase [Fulvivirga sp. M361]|nr:5-dehydro-4-deoxy-D-glucuronate isomerase [Fulvivirga sp. M361]